MKDGRDSNARKQGCGWFILREKYWWLMADKSDGQDDSLSCLLPPTASVGEEGWIQLFLKKMLVHFFRKLLDSTCCKEMYDLTFFKKCSSNFFLKMFVQLFFKCRSNF
jgi:hypothetical protein